MAVWHLLPGQMRTEFHGPHTGGTDWETEIGETHHFLTVLQYAVEPRLESALKQ